MNAVSAIFRTHLANESSDSLAIATSDLKY